MVTKAVVDAYKTAREQGKGTADACRAAIAAGGDFDDVADMSWRIETGKAEPEWLTESGEETQASRDFYAGMEKKEVGE